MANVAVVEMPDGQKLLKVNNQQSLGGSGASGVEPMQALLPSLLHPDPQRALVLGVGAGVTVGTLSVSGVPEVEAVELMLRGLELHAMPGLPRTVAGLRQGPLPTAELYEREIERLVATASGTVPLYPPVSAGGNANGARRLCAAVRDAGCHGAMITLNPDDAEVLRAIREGFGPLSA
ncbi:MAG: hypothetical protein QF410_16345, partial [Planctomycetota bacterium]|nr:hypothetical protein [Planctomycetota bacterium]